MGATLARRDPYVSATWAFCFIIFKRSVSATTCANARA